MIWVGEGVEWSSGTNKVDDMRRECLPVCGPTRTQKRKGMIGGRDDVLKAVWANRISSVLCGGVRGVVAR